jgi:hypothetical protein
MVEGLFPGAGGGDGDLEVFLVFVLPGKFV